MRIVFFLDFLRIFQRNLLFPVTYETLCGRKSAPKGKKNLFYFTAPFLLLNFVGLFYK